ncbi:MAG TPA: hypothetical protein VFE62_16800 [Gemmataceae bacterium]|nr:hypothetical protein [Gemmataceae bacterium]
MTTISADERSHELALLRQMLPIRRFEKKCPEPYSAPTQRWRH